MQLNVADALDVFRKSKAIIPQKAFSELIRKYPGWNDDEKKVIKDFNLYLPKKMIEYILEICLVGFEVCSEGIANIEEDLLTNDISKIHSTVDKLLDCNGDDDMKSLIKRYTDDLMDEIANLEFKINNYVTRVNDIDNLPDIKFFVKSASLRHQADMHVKCTKAAVEAYIQATAIYAVLANERHGLQSPKRNKYLQKRIDYLDGLDTPLMLAYDKTKNVDFWNKKLLVDKMGTIQGMSDTLQQYLEQETETEVNLEEIEF